MGTRRWFVALERWMWKHKMSREDVARRSGHDYAHVLDLFGQDDPNPTLRFYLDLLEAAGARMDTANGNSVEHVVTRLGELRKRAGLSVAELARRSGMGRPHLSGIINGSRANMQLAVFDVLVTVLGAEEEMMLVDRWYLSHEVLLALAAGDETMSAGDGSSRPHLHVVSNVGSARPTGTGDAARFTASHSGTASAAAPQGPPDDAERRAAEEKARAAAEAEARAAAEARARAAEAEARAARERARAEERAARAEQERAEYERARAAEKAQQERAAQERRAHEQARAEAATRAAAQLAEAVARAALQNKLMVGAGVVLAIVGGVCIAKGVAGLRANAA